MGEVRRRGGVVRVDLEAAEVVLFANLVGQVRELLTDGQPAQPSSESADPLQMLVGLQSTDATTPDDPALARLLPEAYRDDAEAAGEYRRLMDAELRAQKAGALQRVLEDLAEGSPYGEGRRFELPEASVTPWLYALTDVRLTLGTRLDVTEDWESDLASLDPDSPRWAGFAVYDWLSWLQNAIIEAAH